jgi:hypothetical protein
MKRAYQTQSAPGSLQYLLISAKITYYTCQAFDNKKLRFSNRLS